jgi:Tfp pilus assembly protein PilF
MPLRFLRPACAGLLSIALTAFAAPFIPASDDQVLERLPIKPGDPVARELRTLRAAAAARPDDPSSGEALARRYFDLAMAEGDPRYIGYAEAALRRWATGDSIPVRLRVIRALLRQYKHDFAGALTDLEVAVTAAPADVEAHAWRAAIFMVQARYGEARAECTALMPEASELFSTGCLAYVDATTGKTHAAYDRLSSALKRHPGASPDTRLWNLTRLAEMAHRLGDPKLAERHFRDALALGVTDNFLLAAFADFLLDENRPGEVAVLLKDWARSDTLLLRLAFAEKALRMATAAQRTQALDDRFSEAGLRGEQLHLQEEARFRLHLKGDPSGALKLATENWKSQREPRDAAILLEAAIAARNPAAAQPALDWLEQSGFEDGAMRRLAGQAKALPK